MNEETGNEGHVLGESAGRLDGCDDRREGRISAGSGADSSALSFDVDLLPGGLQACLEAVLMVADQPQHSDDLARVLGVDGARVCAALVSLQEQYDGMRPDCGRRGFELRHTARGWQFCSRAVYEPVVCAFVNEGQAAKLSQAALEALAIVAYQQPITRAGVAAIRGVNSDGVIRSLTARGLIREFGVDADTRAALLVTSPLFLEKMGLDSLDQLPRLAPFMPKAGDVIDEADEADERNVAP